MATAKTIYPNFSDNGVRVKQFADGSMEIIVIPQDPARLVEFVFTVPATGSSSTSTVLTADTAQAASDAIDFVNNGALPAGSISASPPTDWPSKIARAIIRARRAARQAQIDALAAQVADLNAQQTADPTPPAG